MLNFLKRMIVSKPKATMFDKNVANKITEEGQKNMKDIVTFFEENYVFVETENTDTLLEKQDRCTFEYNAQYKALRNITMLFKNVLKEQELTNTQHKSVELCIKAVRKDSNFIKNRLTEGTYDKTKGTDYDEEVLTLFASLKSLRVIRKTLFYIQENKSHELEQKLILSKLIDILNKEINSRQTMLDSLKKDLNIVVNK